MTSFWNNFYKKKKIISPSNFAKYCKNIYLKKNKKILDIGCGNGRDSYYFEKNKLLVTAIDKSTKVIEINKSRLKNKNIKFINLDIDDKKVLKLGKFDYIYARFFLHTINEISENKLISKIAKLSKIKKTIILFEFRTIKDPLFNFGKKLKKYERFTDHYRRFINLKEFKQKLIKKNNFKIIKIIEKKGLAKFKKENPVVARVILKVMK